MTWTTKLTVGLGLLFLAHACYSAHEYSILHSVNTASLTQTATHDGDNSILLSLPADISIELILAIFVTCFGLVLSTPELQPIQWRVWAGKIEGESDDLFIDNDGFLRKDYVVNPFKYIESRPGFVDIRKQRKEFLEWASDSERKKITEKKNK